MITLHCDRCEQEVNNGILEGYSELDKLANDSGDSYRFHITAVSKLLCSNCFEAMLMNALGLEYAREPTTEEQEEQEQEEDLRESGREQEEAAAKEIEKEEKRWSER